MGRGPLSKWQSPLFGTRPNNLERDAAKQKVGVLEKKLEESDNKPA